MSRSKHKWWQNRGKPGHYRPWTARITWYGDGADCQENIRLELEDSELKINLYPTTPQDAEQIFFMFKQGAPEPGVDTAFIQDLLKLLKGRVKYTTSFEGNPK